MSNLLSIARSHRPFRRGLVVGEALAATSLVAVLVGLLLPAVQSSRVEYNLDQVLIALRKIEFAVHEYREQNQAMPKSLAELEHLIGEDLADGEVAGYQIELRTGAATFELVATPAVAGITGNVIAIIGEKGQVETQAIKGAEENQARMFEELNALAARSIASILKQDQTGEAQKLAPDYIRDPKNQQAAFDAFDVDGDGFVSAVDVFHPQWDKHPVMGPLLLEVAKIMHAGAADDLLGIVAPDMIRFEDLKGNAAFLWNYTSTKALLDEFALRRGTAQSLGALLDNAVSAAQRGDGKGHDRMLEVFQKRVRQEAGKGLSPEDAEVLIIISNGLFFF